MEICVWGNGRIIMGAMVKIEDERKWIRPSSKPFSIDMVNPDYRDMINEVLEAIPETDDEILWISETKPEIELSENVDAVIEKAIYPDITGKVYFDQMGLHITSHYLDP